MDIKKIIHSYFRSQNSFHYTLSLDGYYVAYINEEYENSTLNVILINNSLKRKRISTYKLPKGDIVYNLFWKSYHDIILLTKNRFNLQRKIFVHSILSGNKSLSLTTAHYDLIDASYSTPNEIIIRYTTNNNISHIASLNILTCELRLLRKCKKNEIMHFYNSALDLLIFLSSEKHGIAVHIKKKNEFCKAILLIPHDSTFIPFNFLSQNDFYALTNYDREFISLAKISITNEVKVVYVETGVNADISGITNINKHGIIEGVIFSTHPDNNMFFYNTPRNKYLDFKSKINQPLISFKPSSMNENRQIVTVASDDTPETNYLIDNENKRTFYLGCSNHDVKFLNGGKSTIIKVPSFDGLEIELIFTRPHTKKNTPLLLFPHSGPWLFDSWGFNPIVQCFASCGYAVLQVNFRGSTGYGRNFLQSSKGNWGKDVQYDINAALQYVLKNYKIKKTEIFAFGVSFGGYSVLMQLIRSNAFRAASIINAPCDLFSLMSSLPDEWQPLKHSLYNLIDDPFSPHGAERLVAASPINHCGEINVPLLIQHSYNDKIVDVNQSKNLYDKMINLNKDVTLEIIPYDGHDLLSQVAISRTIESTLLFFQKNSIRK
ncbi:alpha/beta hydrolase family protein [Klebsiella aerogenes]|uniref:alpha/beta hydrolase family protein n=1 Tax=Klebsiella aerogenes TaxID=548 RepID=UPI0037542EF6